MKLVLPRRELILPPRLRRPQCAMVVPGSAFMPSGRPPPTAWAVTSGAYPYQTGLSLAWNGSIFCSLAYDGLGNYYAVTSPDGQVWTKQYTFAGQVNKIAWSGAVFCVVGIGRTSYTSADGLTWNSHANALPAGVVGSWDSLVWTGTAFLCVDNGLPSNKAASSADGATWTSRTMPSSRNWKGAAAQAGTVCVMSGYSGIDNVTAVTADDGANWTSGGTGLPGTPGGPNGCRWNAVAFGAGVFCAVSYASYGTASTIYSATSADGLTWTTSTSLAAGPWNAVASNGWAFLAVGTSGAGAHGATSADGVTWTTRTMPGVTPAWNAVIAKALRFYCLSNNLSLWAIADYVP